MTESKNKKKLIYAIGFFWGLTSEVYPMLLGGCSELIGGAASCTNSSAIEKIITFPTYLYLLLITTIQSALNLPSIPSSVVIYSMFIIPPIIGLIFVAMLKYFLE